MTFARTIYALWLRQIKRSIRAPARLIGGLGMPTLFLVAFGFGLGGVFAKAGNGDYISFLAPGVITMAVLFTSMFSGIEVIWDRQFGFLKETLVTPTSRFSIMIGRTLGGATVALAQGIIVFGIALAVGYRPASLAGVLPAIGFLLLIAILFTALGTAIGSLLEDMQAFPLIMNFLMMPMFFLSGAIFPLDGLPRGMQIVTSLNPLSYGVDAVRGSLSGVTHFPHLLSLGVLVGCCLAALTFGAYSFSKIQL
jgi:ABC-2 type transport system permease protein